MKGNTYVAFLRGINVGGNNIIKMADLRECLEQSGLQNVRTYIQSGNVIFESSDSSIGKMEEGIERVLNKAFKYNFKVLIRSYAQLKEVLDQVPNDWKSKDDLRCYLAFTKDNDTLAQLQDDVVLKEGIDFLKIGDNVAYMTTLLSGITKSGFTKLVGTRVYQNITIRNYNTAKKVAVLMEKS